MTVDVPQPGDPVRVRMRKWDGTEHWAADTTYLGADAHGHWLGNLAGIRVWRPDFEFRSDAAVTVKLIPDAPFVATFMRDRPRAEQCVLYVDVSSVPELVAESPGWTMRAIDLDLDVLGWLDGRVELVDTDEFEQHRTRLRYPDRVVAMARRSGAQVLGAAAGHHEPFGRVAQRWLDHAEQLLRVRANPDPTPDQAQ